jgi:hypothetical protein
VRLPVIADRGVTFERIPRSFAAVVDGRPLFWPRGAADSLSVPDGIMAGDGFPSFPPHGAEPGAGPHAYRHHFER